MHKGTQNLIFFTVFASFVLFTAAGTAVAAEITMNDLGIETPGMLPSNPFYFFKEWGRGIRKSLSFSELKKAELQLDILNEQIAEIKKLDELAPDRRDAMQRALEAYAGSANVLGVKLAGLRQLKGSVAIEKLIDLVLQRSLKHAALLNGLFGELDGSLDGLINNAMQALATVDATIFENLSDQRYITGRLQNIIKNGQGDEREWNAAVLMVYLESVVPSDILLDLMRLRSGLLSIWSGKLRSIEDLDLLQSGNMAVNLELLDEARESTSDSAIRNMMTIARQALIGVLKSKNVLNERIVRQTIQESENKVLEIESDAKIAASDVRMIVGSLVERARFNQESAKQFLNEGSLSNAYSQAMMAKSVARHARLRLLEKTIDYHTELNMIKQYFDSIVTRAKEKELSTKQAKWTLALKDVETQIARLADLVAGKGNSGKIASMLRDIQTALGALDTMVGE